MFASEKFERQLGIDSESSTSGRIRPTSSRKYSGRLCYSFCNSFEVRYGQLFHRMGLRMTIANPISAAVAFMLSVPLLMPCAHAQEKLVERALTSLIEGGAPVTLEIVIFKPPGNGPFPTVVFNHGSTGNGNDPNLFRNTQAGGPVAKFLVDRGWLVAFPQRRGRGQSDGLYDEGFEQDRSRYSCIASQSLPGVDRALEDVSAAVVFLKSRPDVMSSKMVIAGQSRGGILAIAYAGTWPDQFVGAINFVGGWMTDRCPNPEAINTVTFQRGGRFKKPTLWLYGENDPFYRLDHSRLNFDMFVASGGVGTFKTFRLANGKSGHTLISQPDLWEEAVDSYLHEVAGPISSTK